MRVILTTVIMVLLVLVGCNPDGMVAIEQKPSVPVTTMPAPPVMAYVNGKAIYTSELYEMLVQVDGLKFAQLLIATEVIRQAAEEKGITVSNKQIAEQHDLALDEMFEQVPDKKQREALLEQMLVKRRMPRKQWDIAIRRNAMLACLATKPIEVTDAEVRKLFLRRHGLQVVIRHIQTPSLSQAQKVLKLLTDKADFAELARKFSTNASARNGGLLSPINKNSTDIPPAIRQAAFAMTDPGETSNPVQVGTTFHILRLERIIPSADIKFDDVKDSLAADVRKAKARNIQQRMLGELLDSASVRYVDPLLKARTAGEINR